MVSTGYHDYTSPSTRFTADGWVAAQAAWNAGNYSVLRGQITCWNGPSGSTGSFYSGWGQHWVGFDGIGQVRNHSGQPFLPSGYGQNALRWQESGDVNVGHDGNGYHGDVFVREHVEYSPRNDEFGAWFGLPRIARPPTNAPALVSVSEPSPTSLKYSFTGSGVDNGGSGITGWDAQWSTSSDFSTGNGPVTASSGTTVFTGLVPGTTHYFRARAKNGYGDGPWGAYGSGTTLPSVPPGFVVSSSPSGSQATLVFSPPGGVTGVTKYTWERRATGTATPVVTGDSATISTVVTDLVPGNSYDWRASAWIGGYQSPWTDWTTLVQAKPNTNPGDYFDGATPDVADLDYSWTGAANTSTSIATAKGVAGWEVEFPGTGSGVLYRVTAGIFATYAARVQVIADTSVAGGMRAGQRDATGFWTEVTPNATYLGSIHVRPSRSQSLAAEVTWLTAAGAVVSRTLGAASVVAGGTWSRLVAGGLAPASAAWAVVRVIDVAGTGWSTWKGGDSLDLDGAMISLNEEFPYFDGDFLDDGTYVYDWEGDPNASTSTRTPIALAQAQSQSGGPVVGNRALIDPDCNTVPPPPRPPTVPSDCIDDIGVWRRYYAQIPANLVPDWMDVVPTLEITSGPFAARQVRVRYYANPADLPVPEVDTTSWIAEQIISYMPASTVMTLDGVTQRVWAEVAGGDPQSGDHLLYGTNGKPAVWPILGCGISYLVSVEVPIAEPEGNVVVSNAALTART
jgi:hypothetical protein